MRQLKPIHNTLLCASSITLACVAIAGSSPAASPSRLSRGHETSRAGIANVDVSRAEGPQAEVRIAAAPSQPSDLLAASNSDNDPGMRVYSSSDAGHTWSSEVLPTPPNSVTAPCHADPATAFDASGNAYVVFIQAAQSCDEGARR